MASIPTAPASASVLSSVNGAITSTTILAANDNRKGATIYNDSSAILYLALGNVTASTTVYTVQVPANGTFILEPWNYVGIIKGIWASATGAARVTELL